MFYSANNSKLKIDNNEILASTAQITLGTNLSPRYLLTQRHTNEYFPSNGIGGNLSFSYYLTGPDYFKSFITGQGETGIVDPYTEMYTDPISGNFGGLYFESGYLTSYSVNFSPNSPAVAQANVAFFDYVRGEFSPTETAAPTDKDILNFKNATVEGEFASGEVNNFIAGTYNYESEVKPVYLMNETVPSNVSFGPKTVNINFEIDNPTGYLPVSGSRAQIKVELKNSALSVVDSFGCSGVINSRNLASAPGDIVRQTINITQSDIFEDITLEEGFIGNALSPNHVFVIKGTNLMFAEKVFFGEIDAGKLVYLDTTGISGVVPAAAFTNDVVVQGTAESEFAGRPFIILDSDDQVKVGQLAPAYSGAAGEELTITGENFYQITNVKFGEVEANAFEVISPSEINVTIPQNAPWSGVSAFSSLRTGLEGSTTEASGRSVDRFVPTPEVTLITPTQVVSGENVTLEGRALGGVSGFKLNGIQISSFVSGDSSVVGTVPSGDTWGDVQLLLQSGLTYTAPTLPHNYISFKSLAKITAIGPTLGLGSYPTVQDVGGIDAYVETGARVSISGENFSKEILYGVDNIDLTKEGYFLASFGDSQTTGEFKWVNETLLTGVVPRGVPTGTSTPFLYSHYYPEAYPSTTDFTLKYSPPVITSIEPGSGIAGDTVLIEGENFYGITGINMTGAVGIGSVDTTNFAQNIEGSSVTLEIGSFVNDVGHQYWDVLVSGKYGSDDMEDGILTYGGPNATTIDPTGQIQPNATGVITGTNLYPHTTLLLVRNSMTNIISSLATSGFKSDFTELKFTYPNSFPWGDNDAAGIYKFRLKNRRAGDVYNHTLGVFHAPEISGFEPTSITADSEVVTVSGYFEAVTGVSIGNVDIPNFTALDDGVSPSTLIPHVTGITFKAEKNATSDRIKVLTSGGTAETFIGLDIIPAVPTISGFWVGKDTERPTTIDYDQVFAAGNNITISGERLNFVNEIQFTGLALGNVGISTTVVTDVFSEQDYDTITMEVPGGIRPASGLFHLVDNLNREASFNLVGIGSTDTPARTGINLFTFSGMENYKLPGSSLKLSGVNQSGLNVLFYDISGNPVTAENTSANGISYRADQGDGIAPVDTITVDVPTGIISSPITFTGQSNNNIFTTNVDFYPLAAISGVSGYDTVANNVVTGTDLVITGVNFQQQDYLPRVGDPLIGISGTGWNNNATGEMIRFFGVTGYSTGTLGGNDEFVSLIGFMPYTNFIGTGNFFLLNGWELTPGNTFVDGDVGKLAANIENANSGNFLEERISYHDTNYVITGTWMNVTGFGPKQGVPGTEISMTGSGLNAVNSVYIVTRNPANESDIAINLPTTDGYEMDFSVVSDNKITATVPKIATDQRTDTTILLSGGTNFEVDGFSVLVDSKGFVSEVIELDGVTPSPAVGQTVKAARKVNADGEIYVEIYEEIAPGQFIVIGTGPPNP